MESLRAGDPERIGPYTPIARLGSGATGRVFLCRSGAGDLVAVKVIHARFAAEPSHRARFAREVAAARRVGARYTAPVVDHDAEAPQPWLATAYLPGQTLRDAVRVQGPLPAPSVRSLAVELAAALAAIHRAGLVHRDLKPSNVLLTPEGARVVDFGIARPDEADTLTAPGALLGTPGFLPPEQIRRHRAVPAGDVFALGALLVFAATGTSPFGTGSAPVLLYRTQYEDPHLDGVADEELATLVAECLARDPERRPSAVQVGQRLGQPTPSERTEERPLWSRRRLLGIGLAGLAVGSLGGSRPPLAARSVAPAKPRLLWAYTSSDSAAARPTRLFYRPTVIGDRVYLSTTDGIEVLDASRGRLLWTASDGPDVRSGVIPTSEGEVVFTDARRLRKMSAVLGSPVYEWPEPAVRLGGAPVVDSGMVYACGTDGRAGAYNAASGEVAWRRGLAAAPADDGIYPDMVLHDGLLYVATDGLYALEPASGKVRWRFADAVSPPVPYRGLVYTAGSEEVHAVDPRTGRARWSAGLGARIGGGVTAGQGLVFAGDDNGWLHALDAATGEPRWRLGTGGPLRGTPLVAGDTVYAGADTDRCYAVRIADRAVRWSVPVGAQTDVRAAVWRGSVLVCVDLTRLHAYER